MSVFVIDENSVDSKLITMTNMYNKYIIDTFTE